MPLAHQNPEFAAASLTEKVLPGGPAATVAAIVGGFGGVVSLAYVIRYSCTGASCADATATAHPKKPSLISAWVGGHWAFASDAANVAGTVKAAVVHDPGAP